MNKTTKVINKKRNLKFIEDLNIDYIPFNGGMQLNFSFANGRVAAFYPTTNKWVCDGKTHHGDAEKLWDWIGEMEEG